MSSIKFRGKFATFIKFGERSLGFPERVTYPASESARAALKEDFDSSSKATSARDEEVFGHGLTAVYGDIGVEDHEIVEVGIIGFKRKLVATRRFPF